MATKKRQAAVEKRCGTVIQIGPGWSTIMDNERILYRIDTDNKKISKIKLNLGDFVWIYCVPCVNHVEMIMVDEDQGEPSSPEYSIEVDY